MSQKLIFQLFIGDDGIIRYIPELSSTLVEQIACAYFAQKCIDKSLNIGEDHPKTEQE